MRLPFLRSKDPVSERSARAAATDDAADVEAARTRARRRLIGAGVLLLAGVVGFPLLFETQPRPLPVDIPIELRPRDVVVAPVPASVPVAPPHAAQVPPPDAGSEMPLAASTQAPAAVQTGASAEVAAASAAASSPVAAANTAASAARAGTLAAARPASAAPLRAATTVAAAPAEPANRSDDGARARALLEGGASAPAAARFVVQVGAFTDAAALRQARQRVERLGLQTYTQVVETAAGKRTRVRVGPYASRAEADAAAAKVKSAGLPAAILVL